MAVLDVDVSAFFPPSKQYVVLRKATMSSPPTPLPTVASQPRFFTDRPSIWRKKTILLTSRPRKSMRQVPTAHEGDAVIKPHVEVTCSLPSALSERVLHAYLKCDGLTQSRLVKLLHEFQVELPPNMDLGKYFTDECTGLPSLIMQPMSLMRLITSLIGGRCEDDISNTFDAIRAADGGIDVHIVSDVLKPCFDDKCIEPVLRDLQGTDDMAAFSSYVLHGGTGKPSKIETLFLRLGARAEEGIGLRLRMDELRRHTTSNGLNHDETELLAHLFDVDGSHELDFHEFSRVVESIKSDMSQRKAVELLARVGTSGKRAHKSRAAAGVLLPSPRMDSNEVSVSAPAQFDLFSTAKGSPSHGSPEEALEKLRAMEVHDSVGVSHIKTPPYANVTPKYLVMRPPGTARKSAPPTRIPNSKADFSFEQLRQKIPSLSTARCIVVRPPKPVPHGCAAMTPKVLQLCESLRHALLNQLNPCPKPLEPVPPLAVRTPYFSRAVRTCTTPRSSKKKDTQKKSTTE